jgi:hypothetical protein
MYKIDSPIGDYALALISVTSSLSVRPMIRPDYLVVETRQMD